MPSTSPSSTSIKSPTAKQIKYEGLTYNVNQSYKSLKRSYQGHFSSHFVVVCSPTVSELVKAPFANEVYSLGAVIDQVKVVLIAGKSTVGNQYLALKINVSFALNFDYTTILLFSFMICNRPSRVFIDVFFSVAKIETSYRIIKFVFNGYLAFFLMFESILP